VQFDSLAFLAFFLIIAALYWWVPAWHQRKNVLLAASYLFYAGWNPYFLPLLVTTSLIDWRLALHMGQHHLSTSPQKMVNSPSAP
jgi:D-alanyl-lipoteichoic acid acyltransferase DltB (MBOAT superfamily)